MITSFGEEGAGLYASRAFVCLFVLYMLVFVIFLFLLVSAAVCDYGTSRTSINFFIPYSHAFHCCLALESLRLGKGELVHGCVS